MKQFDLQGNEYDIQIRDMIEPIENWQYVSGTRDIGKSYFQNLLNEKDKEIERLNNIINELEKELEKDFHTFMCNSREVGKAYKAGGNAYREHILLRLRELKGSDSK